MIEFETRPSRAELLCWCIGPFLVVAVGALLPTIRSSDRMPILLTSAGIIVVGLAGAVAVWLWWTRARFKATATTFELRSLTRTQTRNRSDLLGGRAGPDMVRLDFNDQKPLLVPSWALKAPCAQRWLKSLMNLDAIEIDAEWDALDRDPRFGATVAQRRRTYEKWGRALQKLQWVALGIAIWAIVLPIPYPAAVVTAAVVPAVAFLIVGLSSGRVTFMGAMNRHLGLNVFTFLLVGPALAARALLDFHMIDWGKALAAGVIGALALLLLAARLDRNVRHVASAAFFGVIFFSWAWGGLVLANALLGQRVVAVHPAEVVTHFGSATDDPRLRVRMEQESPMEADVSRRTFEAWSRGDAICVVIHQGALTWRHYRLLPCPRSFPAGSGDTPAIIVPR